MRSQVPSGDRAAPDVLRRGRGDVVVVARRLASVVEHDSCRERYRLDARTLIQRISTRAHPKRSQPGRVESASQHPFSQGIPGRSEITRGFRIVRKDSRGVRRLRGVAGSSPALATASAPALDRAPGLCRSTARRCMHHSTRRQDSNLRMTGYETAPLGRLGTPRWRTASGLVGSCASASRPVLRQRSRGVERLRRAT